MIATVLCVAGCGGDDAGDGGFERSRSPEEAKRCLDADGFQTEAWPVDTREDTDAPDDGILAYSSGTHAEIAFYDDLDRAVRFESEIRANAKRFDGEVERVARATIVWLMKPSPTARTRIERCVFAG
jgi:hypothetical protein